MCKQGMHAYPSPSSQKRNNNREKTALSGCLPLPRHRDNRPPGKLSPLSITLRPGPRSHLHPNHASHQEKGENCEDKSVQTPEKTSPSALPRPPMPPSEPRATENRRCPDQVSSLQACSFPRLYPIPESPDSSGTVGSQRQGRVEWALKQPTPRWLYRTSGA